MEPIIIDEFEGYIDSKGQRIAVTKNERLLVRLPDTREVIFGRVEGTWSFDKPSIFITDDAGYAFAHLKPGTEVIAHYDRFGVELMRDPDVTISKDLQNLRPDARDKAMRYFTPTEGEYDGEVHTYGDVTYPPIGVVPPDADTAYVGMIRYLYGDETIETVYHRTLKGYQNEIEDPTNAQYEYCTNPAYRSVLGLQNPAPYESAKKEYRFEPGEDMRERVMKKLEEGARNLFESENYKDYLRTMSKFHDYSINNTILLWLQNPDVQVVAGFRAWQEKFERTVKKGERGLKIIVPHPYKEKVKDEKTGVITEKERVGFGIGTVFDVSQTEGKEINLDRFAYKKPDGDYERFDELREAIEKVAGIPVTYVEKAGSSGEAYGVYFRDEKRIEVRIDLSQEATLETLIHETAHSVLHADRKDLIDRKAGKRSIEVEAESVAFVVCDHFGIDTSGYSFAYVAGWSKNKELPELRASAERIHETAHQLIEKIETTLGVTKIMQKQEKQHSASEQPVKAASRGRRA